MRVRGDVGVGAVASAAIRALAGPGGVADAAASRALAEHVSALIALSVGGLRRHPIGTPELIVRAALDEIERNLADPDLSPATVAARIGISTRYLHELLSRRGPSFGRRVLTRRLERSHRDLTDPTRAHWSIGAIAAGKGFNDPSYFARVFRARYGTPPSRIRGRERERVDS